MEELPPNHCYLTYDEVISRAQSIQPHFEADIPEFKLYDPWFTLAVNAQLLSGIQLVLKNTMKKNHYVEMKRLIDMLDIKLASARHCYEKLKYYVDMAFKDETVSHETFGYSSFEKARSSAKKMIPLLNQALETIAQGDNEARLVSSYMPPDLPHEMAQITHDLTAKYGELKIMKKQQLVDTRERIELFNTLWDILSKICDDAKVIYARSPDHLAIYELYDIDDSDAEQAGQLEHR